MTDAVRAEGGVSTAHEVAVRRATRDDLEVVVELRLALLREHRENPLYGRLHPDAATRARILFGEQLAASDEIMYLAVRGDDAVGMIRCVHTQGSPLLLPAQYGYITSAYVVPAARRAGVLRALVAAAEQWCRARGLTELRLHSVADHAPSGAAWEALGFGAVEQLRVRRL